MDLRKIKKLIELVEESGIGELEVRDKDEAVRIVRYAPSGVAVAAAPVVLPGAAARPESPVQAQVEDGRVVNSPLAGTFYTAPAPGEPAFVEVGDSVNPGDVLCIIESMKMMNEIAAETGGLVVEILVGDGEPIATGQALFRIQ